jgi:hypothetical protein
MFDMLAPAGRRVTGASAPGRNAVRRIGRVLAFGLVAATFAGPGAAGAAAETQTAHRETITFADYVPCVTEFPSLEAFQITLTFNGVEHFNENDNGAHFTFTQTGTFSAVPVLLADADGDGEPDFDEENDSFVIAGPRAGESFAGKVTLWGGGNFNRSGIVANTFTFSGRGAGDAGTALRWNSVDHVTSVGDPFEDPAATIKAAFSRFNCR